mgnify:CR=1 FL=1
MSRDTSRLARGSSPLTRGKLRGKVRILIRARLIPAHAGKTCHLARKRTAIPAHPRSRGENVQPATTEQIGAGSSPLTRGKRAVGPQLPAHRGLIPAHAGKTRQRACHPRGTGAHPRSRGENLAFRGLSEFWDGSSPLTRGKRPFQCRRKPFFRLIPAHAGKTTMSPPLVTQHPAHPRSRGENENPPLDSANPHGSSPLTRGKLRVVRGRLRRRGLIPAHAGKTSRRTYPSPRRRAHPRSRGENIIAMMVSRRPLGSSPLTRGKRYDAEHGVP